MSVTILQSPDTLMPAYNDIVFTVDSTNKAQCSFRYVCDIYVESVFVKRLKAFPDPVTGYASFKVNRLLEDFVSYDLNSNLYGSSIFTDNSNTCAKYVLKFGEEYDSSAQCDTGTTVYDNLTVTSSYYAFNAALQKNEWISWLSTNYSMLASTSKFLTNIPDKALINLGSQMTFNFVNSGLVDRLKVITYDGAGTTIGTYTYTNGFSAVTNSSNKILTVGVGTENLNNSTLLSGSQPVINADVSYYTVQLIDSGGAAVSELKRIDIDTRETEFTPHRLWWLNRMGGFDSYDYNLKDKRKVESNRTTYNKLYGSYTSGSPLGTWSYNKQDRGKTVLSVNSQALNTYNSNWLTEDESLWMEELFTSLEVYLSDTNVIDKFCSLVYSQNEALRYVITIPVEQTYTAGDSIYIDFGTGNDFSYLSGTHTVQSYSNGYVVISLGLTCVSIGSPPACIALGTYTFNGTIYIANFVSKLDPIIIKSTTYEEKIKYRIKNIDYTIDVEPAYSINTQRN
jgi:hypothetical protein